MSRDPVSTLFRIARTAATIDAVAKGRGGKRAKNIALGRALGRAGAWRKLWR